MDADRRRRAAKRKVKNAGKSAGKSELNRESLPEDQHESQPESQLKPHPTRDISKIMRAVHSRDTRPEVRARKWLWEHGYRYRKNMRKLPGTPDIVVTAARTAIFVNGCFWHQHEGCPKASSPRSNTEYWQAKFRRNAERDKEVRERLRAMGWRTMVLWECQLTPASLERTMAQAAALLDMARREWEATAAAARRHSQIAAAYDILDDEPAPLAAEEEAEIPTDNE